MNMEIEKEIRNVQSEVKHEDRHVSGYAIRFNEESNFMGFYEVILPSAIDEDTIKRSDIFALLTGKRRGVNTEEHTDGWFVHT